MLKAYKYRLYPNEEQRIQLAKTFGCCRFVYNQTLAHRKNNYEQEKKSLSKTDCNNYCNRELKKDYEQTLKDIESGIEQNNGLYCIYVGQANSLEDRLKGNHVNGREKSTLRKSIGSVLLRKYGSKDIEKKINVFIDKLNINWFPRINWMMPKRLKLVRNTFVFSIASTISIR